LLSVSVSDAKASAIYESSELILGDDTIAIKVATQESIV
jgi:hypothetical protein